MHMAAEMTVRERVKRIQHELISGDVMPSRARELLMMLTGLLGNCQAEVTRSTGAYTRVLAECLDAEKKANRARIRAEMTPEFSAQEEAKNTHALVVEMIRSLKVILKSIEEEIRLSR